MPPDPLLLPHGLRRKPLGWRPGTRQRPAHQLPRERERERELQQSLSVMEDPSDRSEDVHSQGLAGPCIMLASLSGGRAQPSAGRNRVLPLVTSTFKDRGGKMERAKRGELFQKGNIRLA